jgi:16S rRNA (guanine966-N2)-methyltransferase
LKNFIDAVLEWVKYSEVRSGKNRYPTTFEQSEEMARSKNKQPPQSELRIVGGKWRSRKLSFTPNQGLRPTADRIRETLFNWLAPTIIGARCVDLFSGSGALGLEALSRGAAHCDFVDISKAVQQQISQHLDTLEAEPQGNCFADSAQNYLSSAKIPVDIAFIDPPFALGLAGPICQSLASSGLLAGEAWVYVETPKTEELAELPSTWSLYRDKVAGDVAYRLYRVEHP